MDTNTIGTCKSQTKHSTEVRYLFNSIIESVIKELKMKKELH